MNALTAQLGRALVVDDEVELMTALEEALTAQGYEAAGVTSGLAALKALQMREFDLLLTDLMMPGMNGIELLKAALAIDPNLVGIVMTGQGTVPTAVEAMKIGAFDYLLKPFRLDAMLPVLARALEVRRLRLENIQLRETVAIYNLSQVIAFSLDSRLIVEKTVDAAAQQVEADEVSLMLVTPGGDELYVAAVRGDSRDGLLGQRVPLQQGVAGWVARQGEPLILNGEAHDPRFAPIRPRADIRSAISMPLLAAGKLVGVLNVSGLRPRRPFTLGQVKALSILTSTAASALHSAALYEESERLRDYNAGIVETMGEGLTLEDAHGRITYANSRLLTLLGYTADELIGRPWHKIVSRREHAREAEQSSQNSPGQANAYESILVAKDSREIPVLVSATQFEHGGQSAGILATFADLTERKQAEAALAQTNDLLSRAEQIGHIGSWSWDIAADRVVLSNGLYRIFGLELQEFGATYAAYLERVHPDDRETVRRAVDAALREHGTLEFESRIVLPDGRIRVLDTRAEVVLDDQGQAVRLVGIGIDITERKRAEEAVAASEAELRALFAAMTDVVLVLDDQGRYLKIAPTNPRFLYKPAPELIGRTLHEVFPVAQADFFMEHIRRALAASQPVSMEYSLELGAETLWFEAAISPMGTDSVFLIARDVTTRKQAVAQMQRQLERLAALRAIDMAISASIDLQLTLNIVLGQVVSQLQVDAADVMLLHAHTNTLEYAAGRGYRSKAVPHARLRLGQDYAGRVALERRVIAVPDFDRQGAGAVRVAAFEAEGFRAYYGVPLVSKGQVTGVLEVFQRKPLQPASDWLDFLEALAGQAAIAIDNARLFDDLQRSNLELGLAYNATIEGWSRALDLRDKETEGHTQRVTEMTLRLAQKMGITEADLAHISRGALLHDIGKMGIPDSVLLKPGPLTDDEWVIMRQHPAFAYDMLSPIQYLRPALDIPYFHHEKWDGTGYPRQLKGEAIPLAARIFAVVDVWDALRSDRPYRVGWPEAKVREHIRAEAGRHFDPSVVEAFERLMGEAA